MRIHSRAALLAIATLAVAASGRPAADERGDALLAAARKAIGAESRWVGLKALAMQGEYRRVLDGTDVSGEVELKFLFPDRFQRIEHLEFPGGRGSIAMATTLDGVQAWRGPLGGGPARGFRRGSQGGDPRAEPPSDGGVSGGVGAGAGAGASGGAPGAPRAPRPGGPADPAAVLASVTDDYLRTLIGILPQSLASHPLQFEAAGVAESPDGTADVLRVTGAREFETMLFLDQRSHLPLMMTFKAPDPRRMMGGRRLGGPGGTGGPDGPGRLPRVAGNGAGGGAGIAGGAGADRPNDTPQGDPEERRRRVEEMRERRQAQGPPPPPPLVSHTLYFSAHKSVEGLLLPHTITRAVEGQTVEEWTVERYRVNPSVEAKDFRRPSRP